MNIKAPLQLLFLALCCALAPIRAGAQISNVRIAFNGFGGIAPLYLGQDVGIFKKHGLNLEMIFIPGGSLSLQALIGKSLDLLMTGGPPVVNAYLQGAKIKIIGGATNLLPYTFVVIGGIRSAEQLKGKRIGISRFGSNTDYVVRLALNQFALSPNEVQIIQVGGSQARLVAMKSGAIQATVLSPEETLVAQKMGYGILLDFIEKGIEFPHVNLVARDDFLETQPQTVRSFMRAYIESVRYYKTHRLEAISKIVFLSKLPDRQMGEVVYEGSLRATPDDGTPTLKGMEVVLDTIAKENPKAKGLTVQQLVDLRYIP
ncbi:MAG: ABC transporter substrate-binding protein [Deltaproteobacteria bacterium]|jgi:NitT/TauT family transport system substrate-binding protein|nr:MAG: ABC transporter substrate-binding protein [Deltaproteobacteria bacterium]